MNNDFIIKLIDKVLESWNRLDDKHKGSLYQNAVDHLITWKEQLKMDKKQ